MASELFYLGSAPASEDCAQVGQPDYPERSRRECKAFKNLLHRACPIPDDLKDHVRYKTHVESHSYGVTREVVVAVLGFKAGAWDFALNVEETCPLEWDEEARKELAAGAESALAAEGMEMTSI